MLSFIREKVQMVVIGVLLALGPILYVLGLMLGRKNGKVRQLEQEADKQKSIADFYREMDGFDEDTIRPRSRDDLVDRLRKGDF